MSKLNDQIPLLEHFILVTTKTRKVDQLGLDTGLLRSPAAVVPERLGQILGAGQQPLQVVPAERKESRKSRKIFDCRMKNNYMKYSIREHV